MIPIMQVLAVWGGIRAFSSNFGAVFKAVGRPDYDIYLLAARVALIAVAIYPAAELFGVVGVAYVIIGQNAITQPIGVYLVLSIVEGSVIELLRLIVYPLVGSLGMLAAVVSVDTYVLAGTGILQLIALVIVGVATYAGFMLAVERQTGYELRGLYRNIRRAL
jgi:O-antigen/teichoic acid export membrane protein